SFESSAAPGGVGYGPIFSWTGGSGLNTSADPFADNGLIPHRDQVGCLQNAGTLEQQSVDLAPGKNHRLHFRYNVRNCCRSSGNPVGVGYLGPKEIAGWHITGGYGIHIDGAGPFTDNGHAPDQDRVLLIQNAGSLSQTVTGLTAGQKYTLIYSVNRRTCCGGP